MYLITVSVLEIPWRAKRATPLSVYKLVGTPQVAQAELLKLQKSGQFSDDLVRIEGAQIHCVASRT